VHARPKPLLWVGRAKEDLKSFPEEVRRVMGYALFLAQTGGKHPDAKPLKGLGGGGVLEVVDNYEGNAYRAVYTVRFEGAVYVLHAFQKKSRKGIKTPKHEIDIVRQRLVRASEIHAAKHFKGASDEE
jgi:phage-related protein